MTYLCPSCKNVVDTDAVTDHVICPFCSWRILLKKRPEIVRKVQAR